MFPASKPQKRQKPDSSPQTVDASGETMELHALLISFTREMGAKMNEMNNNISALREDVTNELVTLKLSLETWQVEKKAILDKQKELEVRLDRLEREGKRKKVVISGLAKGTGSAKTAVNSLIKESLKLPTEVGDAFEIKLRSGQTKIIAQFKSMDDKLKVMREKKALPKNVFINDDLIARDQFLQFKAREFVKTLGHGKKEVRVRTGAVQVDGTAYVWEEQSQSFVPRKN